jgi:hypothetical protein
MPSVKDTWLTKRWECWVFSFILAITEINTFLALRYFVFGSDTIGDSDGGGNGDSNSDGDGEGNGNGDGEGDGDGNGDGDSEIYRREEGNLNFILIENR